MSINSAKETINKRKRKKYNRWGRYSLRDCTRPRWKKVKVVTKVNQVNYRGEKSR